MSAVIPALLVAALLLWRLRRRARQRVLAGLDGGKPAFHVEPPRRRLSGIRSETLR